MPRRVHREGIKDEGAIKDENAISGNDEQARFYRRGIDQNDAYAKELRALKHTFQGPADCAESPET